MKKRSLVIALSALLLTLVSLLGLFLGSTDMSFAEVLRAVFGIDNGSNSVIILRSIRLPRVVGGIFAGAALAASGLLLQSATGNDLVAPNVVGINSGAGLFVMLILCFFPTASALLPFAAFFGAALAALLVIGLSRGAGHRGSPASVVLAGVAVGSLFGAGTSFLSLLFPDAVMSYTAFSVGGLSGVYFEDIALPVLIIAVFLTLGFLLTPGLNLLALGDDMAASMGVRVARLRTFAVLIAAALASAAVSYVGLIGFVGLMIPHICRRLIGCDNRYLFPLSALLGGVLVVLSDILGRVLFAPTELPCGIFISALGAPFFLFLLLGRRSYDA